MFYCWTWEGMYHEFRIPLVRVINGFLWYNIDDDWRFGYTLVYIYKMIIIKS